MAYFRRNRILYLLDVSLFKILAERRLIRAKFSGACPLRIRELSSEKVTSSVQ